MFEDCNSFGNMLALFLIVCAGDCKLEYDRATGCYLDHAQMAYGDATNSIYGSALPPSQEAPILSLPPAAEPTYDEAFNIRGVNGDSHKASDSLHSQLRLHHSLRLLLDHLGQRSIRCFRSLV